MTTTLQILRGNNTSVPATVAYASPARGLQGTAKVAQMFGTLFLREYDAVRDRGTDFITSMRNGSIRTDASIVTNFTAAVLKILRQLGDQSALPASEQFVRADLIAHSLFGDNLSLTVQLTTLDGVTTFVLPLERI